MNRGVRGGVIAAEMGDVFAHLCNNPAGHKGGLLTVSESHSGCHG